jgi:predicted double-glycine peptidase
MSAACGTGLVLILVGSYAAGAWLGYCRKSVVTAAVAGCLGMVLLRVLFRYLPDLEYALAPYDGYALVRPWWALPFGFVILGTGLKQMKSRIGRNLVTVFAACLMVLVGQRIVLTVIYNYDPARCSGTVGEDLVCRQTTGFTCGAAAAATFLAQSGIESTEREMAILCGTNAVTGTDEFGICRGLRRKLGDAGSGVRVVRSDWEDLKNGPCPAMATVKWGFLVDHWVVVLEVGEEEVGLGDPLKGRVTVPRQMFLRKWRGVLVR